MPWASPLAATKMHPGGETGMFAWEYLHKIRRLREMLDFSLINI
jgi:DUF971 family protein